MRIALVGAEFEENLAVRCIWGALEQAGHEVRQIVFNERGEVGEAARELADSEARLAGFSMVFTYRAREFADLAAEARRLGFRGHLVAGGHFAAFNAEELLRDVPAFDSVAIGEGEGILCDVAAHLDDPSAVRGLVWRDAAGQIVRNAPAVKPPNLGTLPCPVRKAPPDTYLGIPIVNLLSSRGCTHACAFCSIAAWHKLCGGARFRMRTPESVAEEMAQLHEQGVRIFNFHDDNFLLQSKAATFERLRALRRELERRGVGRIAFAVKARPDSVDEELFGFLKEMGLFRVFLGVEAGTAESLRRLGRGQTRDDNERALQIVNRLDIHCCFNLLMLNPDSTLEDFAANVAFLRQHPHNPMNFCRTEIYAGTPLEARLRREGRLRGDYWGYDYTIADPRAQQLFEIVYPVFADRNYGERAVHHQTMSVDYEYQLLAHFFGGHRALRRRVKDYVVAVNSNTCDYLEEIVRAVREGGGRDSWRDLVASLKARMLADNEQFIEIGSALLREIRTAALQTASQTRRRWLGEVVAVGLAASLGLSADAHARGTEPFEEAPDEPRPNGDPRLIRDQVAKELLPRILEILGEPCGLELSIEINDKGAVSQFYGWVQGQRDAGPLPLNWPDFSGLEFKQPGVGDKPYTLTFSAGEVRAAMEAAGITRQPAPPLRDQVAAKLVRHVREILREPCEVEVHLDFYATRPGASCDIHKLDPKALVAVLRFPRIVLRDVQDGSYDLKFSAEEVKAVMEAGRRPPLGDPALVERDFNRVVLRDLARRIDPPRDIQVELWVDDQGKVSRFAIRGLELPEEAKKGLDARVRQLSFPDPKARGRRFVLPYSAAQIQRAGWDTYKTERVPQPRIRPVPRELETHPSEMAPAPPKAKEYPPR